ncbi:MAG: O-antigen ligase family protein, partial [Actinobacteria bacterium]|nr:O-antigen ligase family protein [Actinomycetota bacterium]
MRTWILQRFQTYSRYCIMGAVFLSPVVFNRKTQDVFNLLKFTVLLVLGIAALLLYIAWSAERGIWFPRFNIGIASGAFLFSCLLATVFSEDKVLSLIGLYHRYGGFIPFALYVCIMLTIVGLHWERPALLRDIAKASVAASLAMTAYVVIQALGLDWIPWKDSTGGPPPYPVGTMGNSNFAGGYLGIAIPFFVYIAATAKRDFTRTLLFLFVGIDLIALWFTQTRGGMIAAVAGLLTMAFVYRDKLARWVRLSAIAALALGVILAVVVLFHPGAKEPPKPLANVEALRTGTFSVRTYYWQTAVRIFTHRPVVGVGLDLYYANYPRQRLPKDGAQLGLTITDKPHNIFLEYLANAGALGFLSYLALAGLGLWYGLKRSRDPDDPNRFLLAAFLSVLAGYLAQGVFSIDVPPLAIMGWIALGGIAAIADPGVVRARSQVTVTSGPQGRGKGKKKNQPTPRRAMSMRVARHGPALWPLHAGLA